MPLTDHILSSRAHDFMRTYQPLLVGITGSGERMLCRAALELILSEERMLRTSSYAHRGVDDVAHTILGATLTKKPRSFWRLLIGSKLRELAEQEPDTILVELEAAAPGVIDSVAQQFHFGVGMVTDVGSEALDLFASKDLVAHEMLSLLVGIPKDGFVLLNADDPLVFSMKEHIHAPVLTYGRAPDAFIQLVHTEAKGEGFVSTIRVGKTYVDVFTPHLFFEHQLHAVLGALGVAAGLKLDMGKAVQRLKNLHPVAHDGVKHPGPGGSVLLDFSAHTTPETLIRSLDYLKTEKAQRRLAILGDVTALGNQTTKWYEGCGHKAGQVAEVVVTVGQEMRRAGSSALVAGADVHHFDTSGEVSPWLLSYLHEGDSVLVAGSRHMRMTKIVEGLTMI